MSRLQQVSGSDEIMSPSQRNNEHERGRRELEALFGIAEVLAASYDLETLLNGLMSRLVSVLEPADAVALVFYRADRDCLVVEAANGITLHPDQPWELSVGTGISGKAFQSRQTQVFATAEEVRHVMSDASPDEIWHMKTASGGLEQPRSAIAAPLIIGDRVLGTLTLGNFRKSGHFSQTDVPFVTAIAGLVAMAVDRARLAGAAEQAVDEMRPRTSKHRFLVSFPPGFPVVDADPQRMSQVLHNILDNAVKYSPDGGLIVVRGEVDVDEGCQRGRPGDRHRARTPESPLREVFSH